jgi:hypothetical protein
LKENSTPCPLDKWKLGKIQRMRILTKSTNLDFDIHHRRRDTVCRACKSAIAVRPQAVYEP